MAKPLGAARAVAAQHFISWRARAPLASHPGNLLPQSQSQHQRHEDAVLAEEDESRPRGIVEPRHTPEQQASVPATVGGSPTSSFFVPTASCALAGGLHGAGAPVDASPSPPRQRDRRYVW
jgi:hypothetical protein